MGSSPLQSFGPTESVPPSRPFHQFRKFGMSVKHDEPADHSGNAGKKSAKHEGKLSRKAAKKARKAAGKVAKTEAAESGKTVKAAKPAKTGAKTAAKTAKAMKKPQSATATATAGASTAHEFVSDPSNPHFYVHDQYGQPHFNYKARQSHLLHSHDIAVRCHRLSDHLRAEGAWKASAGWIRNHAFLSILIFGSIVTSFWGLPRASYVDWHIIAIIFELMIVIAAFERYGVLSWISMKILSKTNNERSLSIAMCMLALFLAMFATNDVTILTIIPLVLLMKKHSKTPLYLQMTLVTICANLGSCLTPFGNPHNLYIYTHFNLSDAEFMRYSVPLFATSLVLIFVSLAFVKKTPITISKDDIPSLVQPKRMIPFVLLAGVVFVNLRVNDWRVDLTCAIIAALTAYVFDPRLVFHINWNLIFTLFFIFIMIGNIAHMSFLQEGLTALVHTPMATYLSGLLLSQVISNVPITVLLSQFTSSPAALFFGVDIGGLGSPVASLANLITISLFDKQYPAEKKAFLRTFLGVNFASLLFMGTLFGVLQGTGVL